MYVEIRFSLGEFKILMRDGRISICLVAAVENRMKMSTQT